MAALSDDLKLLLVVLFMLFAPGMVESAFSKVEQHEQQELAISGNDHQPSRTTQTTNESDRGRTARERSQRQERLITFTFTRTK